MEPRPYTTRNFVICVQIWYTAVGRLHSFCRSIAIFVSVCLSVGLYPSARTISQKTICPNITKFSVHVTRGRAWLGTSPATRAQTDIHATGKLFTVTRQVAPRAKYILYVDAVKMRDMKQRERKQRHQNAGVETGRKESATTESESVINRVGPLQAT